MVMQALFRKARHVLDDPVLRRWLVRRAIGMEKSPPGFVAGQPPYLGPVATDAPGPEILVEDFKTGVFEKPTAPEKVTLPGKTVELYPENPAALFSQSYDDLETMLAAHRFAWVPVAGASVDPDWVAAIWQCWVGEFGDARSGWPWHAYTAAERAINIIDFSRRFGLPGDSDETRQLLARHAEIIRENLEYFGDHYTSNHLSNNGRGLLRIGTAIGRADHAETGAKIMVAEAGRIFGRSGVLREGSTHYHILVTRNYIDAWIDAQAAGLSQAGLLREIARRALAVIPGLCLPGGMPLVGDISPDFPPACLARLIGGDENEGWPENLSDERQREVDAFIAANRPVSPDRLAADGWHRLGGQRWQALAFVPPDGWPPMPGHGHEDLGSFELHDGDRRIIVDPGRGTYKDSRYTAARLHNYLTIDDVGASAVNRPYYSADYRLRVIGSAPSMSRTRTGAILTTAGFSRLHGVGATTRKWRFLDDRLEILDRVEGRGRHRICRHFHTTANCSVREMAALLEVEGASYSVSSNCKPEISRADGFTEYGQSCSGFRVLFDQTVSLPFESKTTIARL